MPHVAYKEDVLEQSSGRRATTLVLVATPDAEFADRLMAEARRLGEVACVAHSAAGCLRVATAAGPDLVLLDARLPRQLERMLRSHPATARSIVVRVEDLASSAHPPRVYAKLTRRR